MPEPKTKKARRSAAGSRQNNHPVPAERMLAQLKADVAAITAERDAAERALLESGRQLAAELDDSRLLQQLSAELAFGDTHRLYERILDAAVQVMDSGFASMQRLDAERGELELLAYRGFTPEAASYWKWVRPASASTCGQALSLRRRVIVADVDEDAALRGSDDLECYRQTGIRSVQTTPLFARSGTLVGMLSTHWPEPHLPSERDLRMLDIIARQAADLIERSQAESELQEADRRKDEFLATLAHELRNPLAPLSNSLHILRLSNATDPLHELMERQVSHMARLVDDLMEVSRISRGKIELKRQRLALGPVLAHVIDTARLQLASSGHELVVDLAAAPMQVDADPVRLAQVFTNLLNNAAKFTPRGGRIDFRLERDGAHAVVTVADTGAGIPKAMLSRIFDLFTQVAHTRDRSEGGLGIGLSLARSLVTMHGGTIEARSEGPGLGAQFVVRLPLDRSADAELAQEAPPPEQLPHRRILVVDDNRDAATTLGTLLSQLGADVQVTHSGPAALEALERRVPELVLLDLGMPQMDGFEVARRVRERWGQHITLIALSGWGQEDDRKRTAAAGFDRHLIKPVELTLLKDLLDG